MKNETKGIAPLIIAIVVIVVAAGVGVGVFVATRGGTGGGGGGGGGDIGSATNLSFDVTYAGQSVSYKVKDIGSTNMKIRVGMTVSGYDMIYIMDGAAQTVWVYTAGAWMDMSSTFADTWGTYDTMFSGYQTDLAGVTGTTWTSPDGSVTISNISTATIPDSEFTHG